MTLAAQPDILLLDISLSDINGFEVARRLHTAGFTGAIAALTGYGQRGDREESELAGFNHHLVEPIEVSDVLSLLAKTEGKIV